MKEAGNYSEGYIDGAHASDEKIKGLEDKLSNAEKRNKELTDVLEKIAKWELPETGLFWDKEKTRPTSYEAEYGSNGVRNHFKAIAVAALYESNVLNTEN